MTGAATRVALLETAERLFAERGINGVPLREIQDTAGQSNPSVVAYHFGSKKGLVQALVRWRNGTLQQRRAELLTALRARDGDHDPRAIVWILVRPLADSIEAGEMFVPFLARLSENTHATTSYWPQDLDDWTTTATLELLEECLADLPERLRRGRVFQLNNSVLSLLGERSRNGHHIGEVQLHNYVDAWVGMLTAPVAAETQDLLQR